MMHIGKSNPQSMFIKDTSAKVTQIMSVDSHSKMNIFTSPRRPENADQIAKVTENNLKTFYSQIRSTDDTEKVLNQLQRGTTLAALKSPSGATPIMQGVFDKFLDKISSNVMAPTKVEQSGGSNGRAAPWPGMTPPAPAEGLAEDHAALGDAPVGRTRAAA